MLNILITKRKKERKDINRGWKETFGGNEYIYGTGCRAGFTWCVLTSKLII